MNKTFLRRTLSATAVTGGTAALMLAGITGASAHVGITPDKTAANSYALLTFGVPHGCDASGTTKVTITLPSEINDAQPTVNPNWTVEKVTEQLAEPLKIADGASITKRTSQIVYTAKAPLASELRDALVLSVKLPDAAGKTLYFPALQSCEQGQTDWAEIAKDGEDPHSLKAPAPSITITDAAPAGHGSAGRQEATAGASGEHAATMSEAASALTWVGFAAGIGGLVLGAAALLRTRRAKPADDSAIGTKQK